MSLLLSLIALASVSQDAPAATGAATKPAEKICKPVTITGSRLGRRKVCATKEQWDAQARAAEKDAQDMSKPPPPPPSR